MKSDDDDDDDDSRLLITAEQFPMLWRHHSCHTSREARKLMWLDRDKWQVCPSVRPTVSSGTGYTAVGVEESLYIVNGFYRMTDGKSNEDVGD